MPKQITSVKWSASNIPTGIIFNANSGTLEGIPTTSGVYTVPVTVETNYGKDIKNVSVNVKNPYWEERPIKCYNTSNSLLNSAEIVSGYATPMFNWDDELILGGVKIKSDTVSYLIGTYDLITSDKRSTHGSYFRIIDFCQAKGLYTNRLYFLKPYGSNLGAVAFVSGHGLAQLVKSIGVSLFSLSGSVDYESEAIEYIPSLDVVVGIIYHNSTYNSGTSYALKVDNGYVSDTPDSSWALGAFKTNMRVNPRCLKWSPQAQILCGTGSAGVITSPNGEVWTKYTSNVPKNLKDLEYRKDLGSFFARGTDKLFYSSYDGSTWEQVNSTPIPLSTITRVAYSEETGTYCAVGGTGKYAYFSKDLETWVQSQISENNLIANDIIYHPSTDSWVFMPTSGEYFYTKKTSEINI